jgi:hypothetical protein
MSNHSDSETHALPEGESQAVDLSRRKLGMGLGVSAVFTLASRPVLAGQCMSPSSAASGNLSTHGEPPTCTGLTPAQWVATVTSGTSNNGLLGGSLFGRVLSASADNNPDNGFPGGNVEFNDVFANGSGINWPNGSNGRLRQVMDIAAYPDNGNAAPNPNPISAEFAATLLNIRDGRIPSSVLTENALIGMWTEWRTSGQFAPKAGAAWNADQIVAYLRTLQGA